MILRTRDEEVAGVSPWLWPEEDVNGWPLQAAEFPTLRDTILKHTRGRGAIIQAGGCCGMYPRLWAESFGVVYTFEPEPINFHCLVANCCDKSVFKFQAALSNKPGTCAIDYRSMCNVGGHAIATEDGPIPMLRLDHFAFPHIDVIQLDCEGYEGKVIAGARKLIRRDHPLICVELSDPKLWEMLPSLGYAAVDQCQIFELGHEQRVLSDPNVIFAWSGAP